MDRPWPRAEPPTDIAGLKPVEADLRDLQHLREATNDLRPRRLSDHRQLTSVRARQLERSAQSIDRSVAVWNSSYARTSIARHS